MLTSETKRRIDACRDVLVGKLPQPSNQVELITLALIYKFMDDLDEDSVKLGGKRSFFVNGLTKYRWRALMPQTLSADARMTLFAEGIETLGHAKKAVHLPGLFRDIYRNAFLRFRDGRILTMFLSEVNGFAYSHSEELGNAFEYLLQCTGAQGENGQFRTPRHIIDFMVACLDPQPGEKILDPACGTGGFLVSAYRHILAKSTSPGSTMPGDKLTHAQRQKVYASLAGYDVDDQMVKLSKVNLFLHGFPEPAIHIYDTLTNDARWHEKADLIFANPPFMTPKGGVTPHTKFRVAAKKAEVLFTDYIAEHLTADGRGGVIVPNGIVATTQNAYVKLRRFLVEDSLVAVISLPAGVFKPYSGVKTSILLLDKKLARQTKEILFLKITADGFDLGDKRNSIEANDLPEAERVVKAWLKGKLGESFKTSVAWRLVEKRELLEHRACNLQSDPYLGGVTLSEDIESKPLEELLHFMRNGSNVEQVDEPRKYRVSRIQSIADGVFDLEKTKWTDDEVAEDRFLQRGDILLSHINSMAHLAKTAIFTSSAVPVIHGINLLCLRPRTDIVLPGFLIRALKHPAFIAEAKLYAKPAVNQASVASSDLKQIEIPLPPLEEQRRIVAEIEGYQKVLDGARQILTANETRITVEPDWPMVSFEELCERVQYGLSVPLNEVGRGVKTFRMAELIRGRAFDNGTMKCADIDAKEAKKYRLEKGDLLFNRTNSYEHVGRTGIFSLDGEYVFASYLIRLSIKHDLAEPEFVNAWMNTKGFQAGVKSLASRAVGQSNISASSLAVYKIPLPPVEEQRQIVAELDAEAAQMEAVRSLIPRFEAKIQRVLDSVWGNDEPE
ncbi:MAG: Restriction modification system specificity domain [Pedosphaera sp.]|nr:Restriction modification system specificity domain [Pedosphaera sp.]